MMTTGTEAKHVWETMGLGVAPYRCVGYESRKFQACPGAPVLAGTSCDACGTSIMNVYWVEASCGSRFKVGCDCIARVHAASAPIVAEAKQVKRDHDRAAKMAARKAARAEQDRAYLARLYDLHPGLEAALAVDHPVINDIRAKARGRLSLKQISLVLRLAENATKTPAAPEVLVPAPTGRVEVRGTVVSLRAHEGEFGLSLKMTVKVATADGVWLCWGTAPRSLLRLAHDIDGFDLRGKEVAFTATLARGRDAHFAILKRPTNARLA